MKKTIKHYQEKGSVVIGYARVSSRDNRQELGMEVQKEALNFCDRLYIEKESGGYQDRPQLQKALKLAKACAESGIETSLVVYKLDRLTRKMLHLSAIISELTSNNIRLQSIHEQIETNSLTGRFFCLILGYVAEWELQAISDRTKDGLRKARERGVKLGNKGISKSKEKQVIQSYVAEETTIRDMVNQLNISTATIYQVLKRNNIPFRRQKAHYSLTEKEHNDIL
ncbi:recombinase family protein [Streptococcus suis]|nr:recombinase family protein [Streptococcus suis]